MDYLQTSGTAQSWRRSYQMHVNNFMGQQPNILFQEEDVVQMGGKTFNQPSLTSVAVPFVLGTEFPLLNPITGEPLGATAKHEDVQVILFSLYMQAAAKRDQEALQGPSDPAPATQVAPDPVEAPDGSI